MILCYFVAPLLNILIQYFWTLRVKTNQSYSYSKYRLKEHKLCFNLRGWTTISLYQLQINYSHFLKFCIFKYWHVQYCEKVTCHSFLHILLPRSQTFFVIFKWSWGIALQAFRGHLLLILSPDLVTEHFRGIFIVCLLRHLTLANDVFKHWKDT